MLDDSKVLSRELRERCYDGLRAGVRGGIIAIGVGAASVAEIDRINVLRANLLAMSRATRHSTARTGVAPDVALVDGNIAPTLPCAVRTIVKGDLLSLSIAAASVVAKVTRDRIMRALALRHLGYGWETNVGYATTEHCEAIRRLGVTPHHRRSFAPICVALSPPDDLLTRLMGDRSLNRRTRRLGSAEATRPGGRADREWGKEAVGVRLPGLRSFRPRRPAVGPIDASHRTLGRRDGAGGRVAGHEH